MRRPVRQPVTFGALLLALGRSGLRLSAARAGVSTLPDRIESKKGSRR